MKSIRSRTAVRCAVTATVLALGAAVGAPAASAHEGDSLCRASLEERGNTWQNECTLPFQGFPIGVAGVFDSDPLDLSEPDSKDAEIHIEVLAKMASGPPRALGVECDQTSKGVARCTLEYNPLGEPLSGPEPAPGEIVALICSAHSHAKYSRNAPPAGNFACWSTDAAKDHLATDGWFADNGFSDTDPGPEPEPEPEPGPEPGPLGPLAGAGLAGVVTTVPYNTYLPSTIPVSRSLGLRYVNVDTARHDVVALEDKRPDGSAPWCGSFEDPANPAKEDCPLFWTPLIPGGGSETPVLGLEDTVVGESYAFYCSIHPYMVGTLEVVE